MKAIINKISGILRNHPIAAAIAFAVITRLGFILYTHYTAEDAFITFQFSRRIADGLGFVYNPGEPIYGTTTPLFTLLLAGWMKVFSEPRLGAWLLDLAAFAGTMIFTAISLQKLGVSRTRQCLVIFLFALSSRFWSADVGGMETPLVLLFMAASWYAIIVGSYRWAGILAGLLLWTRVDLAIWVMILAFPAFKKKWQTGFTYLLITAIVYLPWLFYAALVFGSPIPNTITAKAIAYSATEINSILSHFMVLFRLFSLSDLAIELFKLTNLISGCMVVFAAWTIFNFRKNAPILLLVLFILVDGAVLVLYRTTYFLRYFVPLLWAFAILSGLSFGEAWEKVRDRDLIIHLLLSVALPTGIVAFFSLGLFYAAPLAYLEGFLDYVLYVWLGIFVLFMAIGFIYYFQKKVWIPAFVGKISLGIFLLLLALLGFENARLVKFMQVNRHENSLTQIGLWINQNTPLDSTVMLEPLGYIGYYADRFMLDEVGLVTPRIVSLKARGIRRTEEYYRILQPDYVIVHCDDSRTMQDKGLGVLVSDYRCQVSINPLDYNPSDDDHSAEGIFARNACYEIWMRK